MEQTPQKPNESINRGQLVSIAFDLGFIIAIPLIALGMFGKYLDGRFGTEPWLTLIGVALAITTTTIWLTKKFKKLIK